MDVMGAPGLAGVIDGILRAFADPEGFKSALLELRDAAKERDEAAANLEDVRGASDQARAEAEGAVKAAERKMAEIKSLMAEQGPREERLTAGEEQLKLGRAQLETDQAAHRSLIEEHDLAHSRRSRALQRQSDDALAEARELARGATAKQQELDALIEQQRRLNSELEGRIAKIKAAAA